MRKTMKTLLLLIGTIAYGQATINAPAVTLDATGSQAVLLWMSAQGTGKTTAIPAGIDASTTSITVASSADFATPNVIAIDAEHINVLSKSGNVLTVTRGFNETAAAAHAAKASVIELKHKTLNGLGKNIIVATLKQIVHNHPALVASTLTAAAATKEATVETAVQ
jgi:hypothetical protein